jgi:hypothetical protein
MSGRFIGLLMVIGGFGVLSALALADVGYFGILEPHFKSWGGAQVFVDLVIALTLVLTWLVPDARARGVNPWPFVLLTLVAGSFGPLLYLALREMRSPSRATA